jgi:hypothetical protein
MDELTPNQPQAFGSQPGATPPLIAQPIAAASRQKGMSVTKVIWIVVGCFTLVGIIAVGVFGAGIMYIIRSAKTDANGNVSMNLPFGSVRTIPFDSVSENDLGIAVYPGAEPGKTCVRTETSVFTQLSAFFLTSDPPDQVVTFYKLSAGPAAQSYGMPFGTQITVQGQAGSSVQVLVTEGRKTDQGKTRIQITRTTPTAAAR